jgi:indolepyruvate ferredoxin oxidoreductase alpha subunit
MSNIVGGKPGSSELMLGNEAIARGALETGVQVCAGYSGTPSTEIVQGLRKQGPRSGLWIL